MYVNEVCKRNGHKKKKTSSQKKTVVGAKERSHGDTVGHKLKLSKQKGNLLLKEFIFRTIQIEV